MCDDHRVLNPLRPAITFKKGSNLRKNMCLGLYHLMNSLMTCRVEIKAIILLESKISGSEGFEI
jgi:hypothetical protein